MKLSLLLALFFCPLTAGAAWNPPAARNAALLAAAGGLTIGYETWVSRSMPDSPSGAMNKLSKGVANLGDGAVDGALIAASYAAGSLAGDEKLSGTALLAGKSFLIANAAGTVMKIAIGRSRPYTGRGDMSFRPFSFKTPTTSFPSGHTVSAFSVASVFASRYDGGAAPAVAYGLASLVAVQRVYSRRHWLSDVAAGAFIGTYVGRRVARAAAAKESPVVWLVPALGAEDGFSGLRAVYVF